VNDSPEHDGFLALQMRFRAGLGARLSAIEQAGTPEARLLAVHRLAGAAASYGMTELGLRARQCEEALECNAADAPNRLADLVAELLRSIDTV
jgi:HPt (histidine-containing phosphotransfer) domain-containing protein